MKKFTIGLVLLTMFLGNKALGHTDGTMNYPIECCSGYDCGPVSGTTTVNGVLVTTSRFGEYSIPPTLKRHDSTDSRMHVCIRENKMICVFFPAGI